MIIECLRRIDLKLPNATTPPGEGGSGEGRNGSRGWRLSENRRVLRLMDLEFTTCSRTRGGKNKTNQ